MRIHSPTLVAAVALMIGAGTAMAQNQTETQEVEVEVIEAEEGAGDLGDAAGEALRDTGEAIGDAAEETAGAIGQAVEQAGEAIDTQLETADDLDETQRQELDQAAAEGKPVPRPETIMGIQREGQWLSSELIGREVRNPQGEVIGDIGAILFSDQGPDGVIIEVGGFLGMGAKDVAIKWGEIAIVDDGIVVEATEEQLENAPEFVSLEEQRIEAELQAQQEAIEQDDGMLSTGSTGTAEQPIEAEPGVETTQ